MEVLEAGAYFDPTRCPVCGADGYVDDDGMVRCSSCFAELPGDGLDWDRELVWADDGEADSAFDDAIDPEDFLLGGQRGPQISERSRRRDALTRREESLVDDVRGDVDSTFDGADADMLPDYARPDFTDDPVSTGDGIDAVSDDDAYL
jgi:hypothetical protein